MSYALSFYTPKTILEIQFMFCHEDNRNTSIYFLIAEIIWLSFDVMIDDQ